MLKEKRISSISGGMGSTTMPREASTSSGVPTPLVNSHLYSLIRPNDAWSFIVFLNLKPLMPD